MTHLTFLYFPATTQSRPRDPPLCQWFRGGHGIAVPPRMSTQGVSTEGTTEPCRSPLPAPRPRPQPRGLRGADSPACTQPGALGQPCPLFTSIRYVRTCRSGCIQALVSPAGDTSPCTVTQASPWRHTSGLGRTSPPSAPTRSVSRCPGQAPTSRRHVAFLSGLRQRILPHCRDLDAWALAGRRWWPRGL